MDRFEKGWNKRRMFTANHLYNEYSQKQNSQAWGFFLFNLGIKINNSLKIQFERPHIYSLSYLFRPQMIVVIIMCNLYEYDISMFTTAQHSTAQVHKTPCLPVMSTAEYLQAFHERNFLVFLDQLIPVLQLYVSSSLA